MNPETKLTVTQLQAVCEKHAITYVSHQRITYGFSHEVHRLNDDMVIKVFNTKDPAKFKTELAVISSELDFLKPSLIGSGDAELIGRSYILMSYVSGQPLGGVWHKATDGQRETLVRQIADTLKRINEIAPNIVGADTALSWQDRIVEDCQHKVRMLLAKKIITERKARQVLDFLHNNAHVLADSPLRVVYWDIHFDNFIVNDNFELQAIIDLENVEVAALDFPLFVIEKQVNEPWKYLAEDEEKYAKLEDYKKLKSWYSKYYPAMFAFDNLDARVKLYQLGDALHLLVDWSHKPETHQRLDELVGT